MRIAPWSEDDMNQLSNCSQWFLFLKETKWLVKYICTHPYYHVLLVGISLTLSCHSPLSSTTYGMSSRLYPERLPWFSFVSIYIYIYIHPGSECPTCQATRKSCDTTKQFVWGWQYIYIYIHIQINIYIYKYKYLYTKKYIQMCVYIYIYLLKYIPIYIYAY